MFYRKKEISKEIYELCLREGYGDANLIAKWKKVTEALCFLIFLVEITAHILSFFFTSLDLKNFVACVVCKGRNTILEQLVFAECQRRTCSKEKASSAFTVVAEVVQVAIK